MRTEKGREVVGMRRVGKSALSDLAPQGAEPRRDAGDELVDGTSVLVVHRVGLTRHGLVEDGVEHPQSRFVGRLAVGGTLASKLVDGGGAGLCRGRGQRESDKREMDVTHNL